TGHGSHLLVFAGGSLKALSHRSLLPLRAGDRGNLGDLRLGRCAVLYRPKKSITLTLVWDWCDQAGASYTEFSGVFHAHRWDGAVNVSAHDWRAILARLS